MKPPIETIVQASRRVLPLRRGGLDGVVRRGRQPVRHRSSGVDEIAVRLLQAFAPVRNVRPAQEGNGVEGLQIAARQPGGAE